MDDDPSLQAPVVLAVVTQGSDPDLDDVLAAVAAQDHRRCSVIVIGAGSSADLPARVGRVLPGAVVRQVDQPRWFAAVADEVLRLVEGDPAFFCFVRDGVVLAPDAVSELVREAYRSNAGVAGPKFVEWDQPERLVSAGYGVDKFGELAAIAQPGELDQEQHDGVRDVFALDAACLLVRGDLFRRMGGFDAAAERQGETLDLCWRAHVAGARVLVVPDAVARRREPLVTPDDEAAGERNRLRTLFGAYTAAHLARVVPQLAVVTVLQVVANVLTGRFRRAGALLSAWGGVVGHAGAVGAKRKEVAALRVVGDGDVRRLQLRGSAALLRLLRHLGADRSGRFVGVRTAGRQVATGVRRAERSSLVALGVLVVATLAGGRILITRGVPVVGELLPLGGSAGSLLRAYASGWSAFGVGRGAPVPAGMAVTGLAGLVVLGKVELLRTLAVLGALVLGPWGAWRLARPFRSSTARIAALVVYAGLPVGMNAVASARLGGLLIWAATPWVVARIARLAAQAPFVARNGVLVSMAGLALLVAVTGALAPAFVLVPLLAAGAFVLGSLVAGQVLAAVRAALLTVGATAVGALLLLPWPLVSKGRLGWGFGRVTVVGPDHLSIGTLARFAAGPHGHVLLTVGGLLAALAALAISRGERLGWAARGVVLAAVGLVGAWLASRGSLGAHPPTPEVFLAPAALGLAMAAAAGGAEFDRGVRGAHLSWRQPVAFLGALAAVLAAVPTIGAHADGRFGIVGADTVRNLRFLPSAPSGATERILWIGRPGSLAGGGWPLAGGLSYAVTEGGGPTLVQRWYDTANVAERELGDALLLAADGQTDRLGHLLAPAGVRFVIVETELTPVARPAPTDVVDDPQAVAADVGLADAVRQPATLLTALAGQLDLSRARDIDRDGRLVIYENTSWIPVRAQLRATSAAASRQVGAASLVQAELDGATPVLPAAGAVVSSVRGPVDVGTVYVAQPLDQRWKLHTASGDVSPEPAFGWASSYTVRTAGPATLRYRTSPLRWLALLVQAAALLLVAGLTLPRRGGAPAADVDDTLTPARGRRSGVLGWYDTDGTDDDGADGADGRHRRPEVTVPVSTPAGDDDVLWGDEDPSWAEDDS